MSDCYVVMGYDGHQRDSFVVAVFTQESAAAAYRDWCKASTDDPEYGYDIEAKVIDGSPAELPGGYAVTIDERGDVFNKMYWSTFVEARDPAEVCDRYSNGPARPPVKCFSGYGSTPQAALASAEALRRDTVHAE